MSQHLRVRSGLVDCIWSKETRELFDRIEFDISAAQNRHLKLAIPGIIGVAGLAGAGVFGAIFLGRKKDHLPLILSQQE